MVEQDTTAAARRKADAAAEALAAEGVKVTARAVQERAGVRLGTAGDAARAWNQKQAEQAAIPPMPEAVQFRVDALWREAITAARSEHDEARAGWEATRAQLQTELTELGADLERVEGEKETEHTRAEQLQAEVQRLTQELAEQRSRADTQTGRALELNEERGRLAEQLRQADADRTQLREQLAALSAKPRK